MAFMGAGMRGGPQSMLRAYGQSEDKKSVNWGVIKRLLAFVAPYSKKIWLSLGLMLLASILQLAGPYLIKMAIDNYIGHGDFVGLSYISLALLVCYLLSAWSSSQQSYLVGHVGQSVLRDMRSKLFAHMQRLSQSYYDKEETGRLISYVVNDVSVINELLSSGIVTIFGDSLILIGIVAIMLSLSPQLALLCFSVLPLMLLLTWWFSQRAASMYRLTRQKIGAMIGRLAEDLSTVRVIKAFAEEDRAIRQFDSSNRENRDANITALALAFAFSPAVDLLASAATLIVLYFGGRFATAGIVSVGTIVAFLTYVSRFFQPIQELSQLFNTLHSAAAGGERVLRLLDTKPEISDSKESIDLQKLQGNIKFDNASFAYDPEKPILQQFDLNITPGEKVAIVGPTGAGKSTIAKLIARHYDVQSGAVMIDGYDVRELKLDSLRRQIGIVPQEPFLFAASIAENIRFGRPEASDAEVEEAAKLAHAHNFITALPEGYNTLVREGAANLSLGQRQLVCLARVMLAQPSLIILDEATSSVDTQTESLIQEAMRHLLAERTAVIIAHRLATVREVTRIVVLNEGRIVETGSHQELVQAGGLYSQLYTTQMSLR